MTETRLIMGTTTSSEKNTQSAVDHSSGFHIFEFHLPTAGLGAGVFIFVLLILVLLYYCRKNFSKRRPQSFQPEPMVQYQLPRYPMMVPPQAPFPLALPLPRSGYQERHFRGAPRARESPRFQELPPEDTAPIASLQEQDPEQEQEQWRKI